MLKKEEFKKLASRYNTHLYTGLYGYVMRYCHRQLENFKRKKKYPKVLEIGAGNAPHLDYLKHEYDEYFIAETFSKESVKYFNKAELIDDKNSPEYKKLLLLPFG